MAIYDDHFFNPPAPLARVTLRDSTNGKTVSEVPMLLGSGADVSLIPQQSVTLLGISVESDTGYEVTGFDGRKSIAPVVSLDLNSWRASGVPVQRQAHGPQESLGGSGAAAAREQHCRGSLSRQAGPPSVGAAGAGRSLSASRINALHYRYGTRDERELRTRHWRRGETT